MKKLGESNEEDRKKSRINRVREIYKETRVDVRVRVRLGMFLDEDRIRTGMSAEFASLWGVHCGHGRSI